MCCNFSFLENVYIHARRTGFSMLSKYLFVQIKRAYILVVIKTNRQKVHIFLRINFCIRNKNTRTFTAKFNTHNHFGKFDIFAMKFTNTGKYSIFSMWMNLFSVREYRITISGRIFSAFNCSTDLLVNVFFWTPVRGVCTNNELVDFQPRTVTPPEPMLFCLLLRIYTRPAPPSLPADWCLSGGAHPPTALTPPPLTSVVSQHSIIYPPLC